MARSLDEGRTWRDARVLQKGYSGAVRQMIQTRAGRVVVATQNFTLTPPRHVTVTYSSDDQGLTWRASNIIDLGGRGPFIDRQLVAFYKPFQKAYRLGIAATDQTSRAMFADRFVALAGDKQRALCRSGDMHSARTIIAVKAASFIRLYS